MINYCPTPDQLARIEDFAIKQLESGSGKLYSSRGEKVATKAFFDIVNGKCGEFAAYNALCAVFPQVSEPSLEIFEKRRKSYDADLVVRDKDGTVLMNVHVKTQTADSIKRYGKSWLFQKTDKLEC